MKLKMEEILNLKMMNNGWFDEGEFKFCEIAEENELSI